MIFQIFQDALFAAIAAIGFSAISNPPRAAYKYCALIAAVGHSIRFILMNVPSCQYHIVFASLIAALTIGILSVLLSPRIRVPAETFIYPSLLPMIPGIYAYKTFGAMIECINLTDDALFNHYFHIMAENGLTCFFILLALVVGATVPVFVLKHISFSATRHRKA